MTSASDRSADGVEELTGDRRIRSPRIVPSWARLIVTPLVVAPCAFLAILALLLAWVPIYANAVITERPRVTEESTPAAQGPFELMSLEIEDRTGGAQLLLPSPLVAAAQLSRPQVDLGGWAADRDDPARVTASQVGAVIRIRGAFSTLDFTFVTGPQSGAVELRLVGAEPVLVDLSAPESGVRTLTAESGHRRVTMSQRFAWRGQTLTFAQAVDRIETATLGSLPLEHRPSFSSDGRLIGVDVSRVAVLKALVGTAWRALPLLLVAGLLSGLALGFGTALEVALTRARVLTWARPERFAAGLAVGLSIVGALNYYAPVALIIPVVVVMGASGLLLEARRGRLPHWHLDADGAAVTGIVLGIVALPFVITDRWAIGFLQTDVYDTFNLTQLFWDRSALDAGTLFGNGFRLLDYSAHAAVAGWSARPSDAVVVLRLVSIVLMVPILWTLATRLCRQRFLRWVVTLGIGLNAALLSLYAEGYMTRHFFATWMIVGFALLMVALHDRRPGWGAWGPAAASFAVAAAVVPPYFVPVLAAPLALLFIRLLSRRSFRQVWMTYRMQAFGAASILIAAATPNLLWLREVGDAQPYVAQLNALVRSVVVPFYDSVRFPATLLGVLPFHANDGHTLGMPTGVVAPGPLLALERVLDQPVAIIVVITLIVMAVTSSLFAVVGRSRRVHGSIPLDAAWTSALAVVVLGFAALRVTQWNEQTYFVTMWAWTLAPVGVLLMAVGMASALHHSSWVLRFPAVIGLVLLMLVNLASSALEGSRWLEDPRGSAFPGWHFYLVADLQPFSRALKDGNVRLDGGYELVVPASALTGTDDDRVLANVLVGLLAAAHHNCLNCRRAADTYGIVAGDTEMDPGVRTLVIGGRNCPSEVAYQGERFVICTPAG